MAFGGDWEAYIPGDSGSVGSANYTPYEYNTGDTEWHTTTDCSVYPTTSDTITISAGPVDYKLEGGSIWSKEADKPWESLEAQPDPFGSGETKKKKEKKIIKAKIKGPKNLRVDVEEVADLLF